MRLDAIGDPRKGDAAVSLAENDARLAWPAPSVAVCGVRRGDAGAIRFAETIVRTLEEHGDGDGPIVHTLARGEGAFVPASAARAESFLAAGAASFAGGKIGADVQAIDAQLATWVATGGDAPRVLIGSDFIARSRVDFAVAISRGAPSIAWSPAARSVHGRLGLILVEPRPGVAAGIARSLLRKG